MFDGKGVVHRCGGASHVRLHVGANKYKHTSLQRESESVAFKAVKKLWEVLEMNAPHGVPSDDKPETVGEYVKLRQEAHEQRCTSANEASEIEHMTLFCHHCFIPGLI